MQEQDFTQQDAVFQLVEYTRRNIFLTGKAGTGKTTFLKRCIRESDKKLVVLAPTGIAAINAGGMTVHSFFGMPLRMFVPSYENPNPEKVNAIGDIRSHFNYQSQKLKIMRELELIILDEVSMLRADILDMMDIALRQARRSPEPFGGVQLLLIGDLYQLPPVLKSDEESLFKQYYSSPYFFSAKAFGEIALHTIQLTKVYRQSDPHFLHILEDIRNGHPSDETLRELNNNYRKEEDLPAEHYITLCSHNYQADAINAKYLDELPGRFYSYHAEIEGDFSPSQFPAEERLVLKKGAQIMFIRNDTGHEAKYFNGKIAEVIALDEESITVEDEDGVSFTVFPETWENKKYSVDAAQQLVTKKVGSFSQLPVRLAWAVTVHKSQGLTFDKMIINVSRGFASGQVYVALSRCRTLEGIILTSRISSSSIFVDNEIISFHKHCLDDGEIPNIILAEKYPAAIQRFIKNIRTEEVISSLIKANASLNSYKRLKDHEAIEKMAHIKKTLEDWHENVQKLAKLLLQWSQYDWTQETEESQLRWQKILEKCKASIQYVTHFHKEKIEPQWAYFKKFFKNHETLKEGKKNFTEFQKLWESYLSSLSLLNILGEPLFINKEETAEGEGLKVKEKKIKEQKKNAEKIPTKELSAQMFLQGLNIEAIAKERDLKENTIWSHLTEYFNQDNLSEKELERLIEKVKLDYFLQHIHQRSFSSLTEVKIYFPENFSFQELKFLLHYYKLSFTEKSTENAE